MSDLQKKSDSFEDELDEFFKERALFRAQSVCDNSRLASAYARDEESSQEIFAKKDPGETGMSGCCMTGCFDCPWDYKVPNKS